VLSTLRSIGSRKQLASRRAGAAALESRSRSAMCGARGRDAVSRGALKAALAAHVMPWIYWPG